MTPGSAVGAAGLALLGLSVGVDGYFLAMVPGLVVSGIGHGMTYTSMFVGGTRDVSDDNQGVAGALMTTTQYAGGSLGVACLVLVLGSRPDEGSYTLGFLLAAAVAVGGALLAWTGFAPAGGAQSPAGTEPAEERVVAEESSPERVDVEIRKATLPDGAKMTIAVKRGLSQDEVDLLAARLWQEQ